MGLEMQLAWRNLWRNPMRSVLTMAAVGFAAGLLVFMLSWQFGSYETMIDASLKVHTGHLQVQAPGFLRRNDMHLVVKNPARVIRALRGDPGVAAFSLRCRAFSLISSGKRAYGGMVLGIDPEREVGVTDLLGQMQSGRLPAPDVSRDAVLGSVLARNLGLALGDEVVVLGQGRDGSIAAGVFGVAGTAATGQDDFDRSVLYVSLATFQDMYAMDGAVHEAVVRIHDVREVEAVRKRLMQNPDLAGTVVLTWQELLPGLLQSIRLDMVSGFIFYAILIIVVGFSIMNTFLMNVFDRTREFGVLLALGARPFRLVRLLLLESSLLTLAGIAAGLVSGIAVTWYFQKHGIVIAGTSEIMARFGLPERMFPRLSMLSVLTGPGTVFLLSMLTSIYPAVRVARLDSLEAMQWACS